MQYKKQKKAVNIIRIILHTHKTTYAALNLHSIFVSKNLRFSHTLASFCSLIQRLSENLAPHKLSVWWWGHQSSLGNADIPLIAYIKKPKMFIVRVFVWHLHIIYIGMYVLSFCWSVCFWATWLYLCALTDQRDNRS